MVMNRIKIVLAEQRGTCKWLAMELGIRFLVGQPIARSHLFNSCVTLQQFLILTLDVY